MKDQFVIVIGRQYGSGGRDIGRRLAAVLGVGYYDRELLSEAAGKVGFSPDIFREADEKRPSRLRSLLNFCYGSQSASYPDTGMYAETLYGLQSKAIEDVCSRGSCVVIGRTADYVMRSHPKLLSVFVHAPEDWRAERIVRRGEAADIEEALVKARRADHERRQYYNYFTPGHWGEASNYHLSIDVSRIGVEKAVELIVGYLNRLQ